MNGQVTRFLASESAIGMDAGDTPIVSRTVPSSDVTITFAQAVVIDNGMQSNLALMFAPLWLCCIVQYNPV